MFLSCSEIYSGHLALENSNKENLLSSYSPFFSKSSRVLDSVLFGGFQ